MIYVFTKTPPTQGSRKVVRFMQNEPQFILYRAQPKNVNVLVSMIHLRREGVCKIQLHTLLLQDLRNQNQIMITTHVI